ncbi:MAG: RNA polymerase sigma factor RpoH [Ruminobacter sp.]|nr:RNA polymerase sigma factor RpoH [Ruminobacter sp.]
MFNESKTMLLAPCDSIESYIQVVNSIPLLTAEEEYRLALEFKETGNVDVARQLVLSHLRFVVSIARGYLGYGLPLADLVQEGTVGLMKAVKRFDVNQGVRLAAFAVHWIKAEIHDYVIKNWRLVKIATTKAQRKLFFKLKQAKKHLGWFNSQEKKDLAENLGVSIDDVEEMETRLSGNDFAYDYSADANDSEEEFFAPASYVEDSNSDFALALEEQDNSRMINLSLKNALEQLDDRAKFIIQNRWLNDDKLTLQELSEYLGVSLERVRQLEKQALTKIKNFITSKQPLGIEFN